MNIILTSITGGFTLSALFIVVACMALIFLTVPFFGRSRNRRRYLRRVALANTDLTPKTNHNSRTYFADGAIAKYLLLKIGSDATHVTTAGAADRPLGNSEDAPAAAEDPVNVDLLGVTNKTRIMLASEAITAGDLVYTAASGKVQNEPAAAGTYYCVGRALTAATADGDKIVVATIVPEKLVVIANVTVGADIGAFTAATVGADLGAFTDPPSAAEMAALRTFVNALKADHAATLTNLATLRTFVNADKADQAAIRTGIGTDTNVKALAA